MAEISRFFNAQFVNGVYDREYLASDFAEYFGSVLSAGLLLDDNEYGLQVTFNNGLEVSVSEGKSLIKGYYYENTTPLTLSHNLPETDDDRIDRIVLRLDLRNQNRHIKAFVKEGVAGANPSPPSLQRDDYIYELSLAQVVLRANTASIDPIDIMDERAMEGVCGIVQSLITVPTSVFQQQFDVWFDNRKSVYEDEMEIWKDSQQVGFVNWREMQQQGFLEWVENIQDILDDNAAGNLMILINDLQREFEEHSADLTSQEVGKGASLIGVNDSTGLFTATNVEGALKEAIEKANSAFTSASNGKQLVGNAITGVDNSVVIPTDPTFQQLADGIGQISTGKKWVSLSSGVLLHSNNGGTRTYNYSHSLGVTPTLLIFRTYNVSSSGIETLSALQVYATLDGHSSLGSSDSNQEISAVSQVSETNIRFTSINRDYYPLDGRNLRVRVMIIE